MNQAAPAGFTLRRAAQHSQMPWSNGGGITREVVAMTDAMPSGRRDTEVAAPWRWRLSIADVDIDGPFSALPGVQRTIAMLHGDGFVLTVGDDVPVRIDVAFRPFRFDGAKSTSCQLIGAGVVDLNLMERCEARTLDLRFEFVAANRVFEATSVRAVLLIAGAADVHADPRAVDSVVLRPLDALISSSLRGGDISVRSTVPQSVVALVAAAVG